MDLFFIELFRMNNVGEAIFIHFANNNSTKVTFRLLYFAYIIDYFVLTFGFVYFCNYFVGSMASNRYLKRIRELFYTIFVTQPDIEKMKTRTLFQTHFYLHIMNDFRSV